MKEEKKESLITRALALANEHHARVKQTRKYTGEPYILHPISVATRLRNMFIDRIDWIRLEKMICAALLHDVIEDTEDAAAGWTKEALIEEIREELGEEILAMVLDLTDPSKPSDGNRKARKAIDRAHTSVASWEAQTIKCFDIADNVEEIVERDLDFARIWISEKDELLAVMTNCDQGAKDLALERVSLAKHKLMKATMERSID